MSFPPLLCTLGRTKPWGVWGPKADNIYIVGTESLQFEWVVLQFSHGSWEYVLWWYFFLVHHLLAEIGRLLQPLKYGIFPSKPILRKYGLLLGKLVLWNMKEIILVVSLENKYGLELDSWCKRSMGHEPNMWCREDVGREPILWNGEVMGHEPNPKIHEFLKESLIYAVI